VDFSTSPPTCVGETDTFSISENEIHFLALLYNVTSGGAARFDIYRPDGVLYGQCELNIEAPPVGNYWSWYYLDCWVTIAGSPMVQHPGQWHTDVNIWDNGAWTKEATLWWWLVSQVTPTPTTCPGAGSYSFITTDDNENNALTGSPDYDMYPAFSECMYRNNPLHPIEFRIFANALPSPLSSAQLALRVYDVDEQDPTCPERDQVFFNGTPVGYLTGANQVWSTTVLNIDPALVQLGGNLVQVYINTLGCADPGDPEGWWCTAVDWGQLVLEGGGGAAHIRSAAPDRTCYWPGATVNLFVEVDTSLASQEVAVEVNILDAAKNNLVGASQTKTIYGSQDDAFIFALPIPATAATGDYVIQIIVTDTCSQTQNDYREIPIRIDPTCGTATPPVTYTPTPTATRTPTPTRTRTPSPTPTITATLCPGESVQETKTIHIPSAPARADIVFAFDASGSMADEISAARANAITIMNNLAGLIPDVQFGVVDFLDYPTSPYGGSGDHAYRLHQAITGDRNAVQVAINAITTGYGGDEPEAYTRALYESYADPAIRWRRDARRFVVMFGDSVAHDDDLNAGVPSPPYLPGQTWRTGYAPSFLDPGRDGQPGTADDLDFQAVLEGMRANNVTLLFVTSGPAPVGPNLDGLTVYWANWAGRTGAGGSAVKLASAADLPSVIQSLVTAASRRIGRLALVADPPQYQSWIRSVPPEYTDLDIPPAGLTVNFQVTISPPPGTLAGTHTFVIKAVGDGAVYGGQGVTITVPPSCAPTPQPCTVTGSKKVMPDQAKAGQEVTVVLSLTGQGDCPEVARYADVMPVIDRSGSMSGQPLADAKAAAKAFIDLLNLSPGADQVGLVSYSDAATLDHQLARMAGTVRAAVDALVAGGNTNITDGINVAQAELQSGRHNPANQPVIVLMTDGVHNVGPGPGPAADAAKARGTRLITIGLGSVNEAELRALASSPGDYYYAPDSSKLAELYAQVAGSLKAMPARDLILVDELSPEVTLVPGSITGAPQPSISGRTLTWRIPVLGRWETRVFTYRVRLSDHAQGQVCTNQSTVATYIDSNGHPATLNFSPLPCVTVKPQLHDVFCKDHSRDTGQVPSNPNGEAWWASEDVWVRYQPDGGTEHQNPQAGVTNYVYVRVRNRGNVPLDGVQVDVYAAPGAAAIPWPGGWNFIGTVSIGTVGPGGAVIGYLPWQPLVSGHTCFLMRIRAPLDPVRYEGLVPFDNNLCQKNVQVLDPTRPRHDNPIIIANPRGSSVHTDVKVSAPGATGGSSVTLTFRDPAQFLRWRDGGGEVVGGQVITGTTSVRLTTAGGAGGINATLRRVPLNAGEQALVDLSIEAPPERAPLVEVRQQINGEDQGGSIYRPPQPWHLYLPLIVRSRP